MNWMWLSWRSVVLGVPCSSEVDKMRLRNYAVPLFILPSLLELKRAISSPSAGRKRSKALICAKCGQRSALFNIRYYGNRDLKDIWSMSIVVMT